MCIALANKEKTNKTDSDIYTMMKNCSNNHMELTKNAAMGKGFDRHLFALKNMGIVNIFIKYSIFAYSTIIVCYHFSGKEQFNTTRVIY